MQPTFADIRIRPEIAAMQGYAQGRQAPAGAFKLSSNENPTPPLPSVLAAIEAGTPINRYPDAAALPLREALAQRYALDAGQVHIGAGSVSILSQLITMTAVPDAEFVYSWRSFEAYPLLVTVAGGRSVQVPNTPEHRHDLTAMAEAVTERTSAVIVCHPNNPTGTAVGQAEFEAFMEAVPSRVLVILDEAYIEFVSEPDALDGVTLLGRYPNLVVLRTFSKAYGLAGLRVGYALGSARLLDAARAVAIPLSVTGQAQAAALASLQPAAEAELLARVAELGRRRDELAEALRAQGWPVPQAQGNFVWLPLGARSAAVAAELFEAGLITRAFDGDGIRISVGEEESVPKLLSFCSGIVGTLPSQG